MKNTILYTAAYEKQIQQYGHYLRAVGYAESTVKSSPWLLRELLAYLESKSILDIANIEREDIEGFMKSLKQRASLRNPADKIAASHQAKYWQAVQNFDKYLRQTGQTSLAMPKRKNLAQTQKKIEVLSQAEIQELYALCELSHPLGLRDRAMLAVFYGCGLRRKEGLSLELDDIKDGHNLIHVRAGKGRKERYVPMSRAVKEAIQQYINQARPELLKGSQSQSLFISERGTKVGSETLSFRLKNMSEKAASEALRARQLTLHLLRHSIATHLFERGMNIKRVGQFLGHAHLENTQIYTHISHEEQF
jgi:site-specific recombinase XerD